MAKRTKTQIVDEARAVAAKFGVTVVGGDHAGAAGAPDYTEDMPAMQGMLRLQLLMIELLANIRDNDPA